ncbi:hypothetical protein Tco_0206175 [Tanacetum coccineum]
MKGGIRIEGDEITIYKKVTKIKTSNQTKVAEIAELEVSEEEFLEINESIYFNQKGSRAFQEQFKPCDTYKQPYNTKLKSALGNQPKITTGLIKEKMLEFKIKKPEESSLNWKPWHKDWDAITSNYSEDNVIKDDDNDDDNTINDDDKYRYNRKGFLEDDESSDDSIFIVDPGWDDYSLQAIKSNRPIPLCPEARRARM